MRNKDLKIAALKEEVEELKRQLASCHLKKEEVRQSAMATWGKCTDARQDTDFVLGEFRLLMISERKTSEFLLDSFERIFHAFAALEKLAWEFLDRLGPLSMRPAMTERIDFAERLIKITGHRRVLMDRFTGKEISAQPPAKYIGLLEYVAHMIPQMQVACHDNRMDVLNQQVGYLAEAVIEWRSEKEGASENAFIRNVEEVMTLKARLQRRINEVAERGVAIRALQEEIADQDQRIANVIEEREGKDKTIADLVKEFEGVRKKIHIWEEAHPYEMDGQCIAIREAADRVHRKYVEGEIDGQDT